MCEIVYRNVSKINIEYDDDTKWYGFVDSFLKQNNRVIIKGEKEFVGYYYQCKCGYKCKERGSMKSHLDRVVSCQPNIKKFENEILTPLNKKEIIGSYYQCKCDYICKEKWSMKKHLNIQNLCLPDIMKFEDEILTPLNTPKIKEITGSYYQCKCEYKSKDRIALYNHINRQNPCQPDIKEFEKEILKLLNSQVRKAKEIVGNYYQCKCDYKTKKRGDMKSHINRLEPCQQDIKKFENDILVMIKLEKPKENKFYKCKCDYNTKVRSKMKRHLDRVKPCQLDIKNFENEIMTPINESNESSERKSKIIISKI